VIEASACRPSPICIRPRRETQNRKVFVIFAIPVWND
jgi:hypothetical protein